MILCGALRKRVRNIHFIGIGGIGMSGIAELLCRTGYHVTGSDIAGNYNTKRLEQAGAVVFTGAHDPANVEGADIVVYSSAVKEDNPELIEAAARNLPLIRRAEMLAELMRFKHSVAVAGSHGKTTTTSLIATLFEYAGMEPTTINGGIINRHGTNARLGKGDWIIAEADESDGTFLHLPATVAVITNIDPEHLDHYGDYEVLKGAFTSFIRNLPFYGFAVVCADHPVTNALRETVASKKIISYGFSEDADIRGENLRAENGASVFDVSVKDQVTGAFSPIIKDARLNSPGRHNALNSLAALAAGHELGIDAEALKQGIGEFKGVKRRFTVLGQTASGATVVDDYAHHPVEIQATLAAARQYCGPDKRIFAVFEPHRYTRVRDLAEEFACCFGEADILAVLPIYPAGEKPLPGVTRENFAAAAERRSEGVCVLAELSEQNDIIAAAREQAGEGDVIICMGAGPVTLFAQNMYEALQFPESNGGNGAAQAAG